MCIRDSLSISNGKALVLFTAKTDMEEVYSILSEKNLPYKILMQQPGSSQDLSLIHIFRMQCTRLTAQSFLLRGC